MDNMNVIKVAVRYSDNGSSVVVNPVRSASMTATAVLAGPKGNPGAKGDKGDTGATGATGAPGAPGVIQTVNGKTGANITLNAADVGADASGSAAAALTIANSYADAAVSTLDNSLGSAAHNDTSDFATAAQGAKADTAVQIETDPSVPSWAKTPSKPTYNKSEVGLGNVSNLAPADMPVSTATQTALNAKANASDTVNLTGDQTVAGVKTFSSSPIVPTATTDTQVVNKAQMDAADALKVNKAGDTMTGNLTISNPQGIKSLDITSTFDGGYNNFDSTGRINLHSHQRAQKNNDSNTNTAQAHYGEVIRIDMEKKQAKGVIAFREDYLGAPEGPRTVAWLVAHGEANDSTPQNPVWHNHFSIELPDETGALQTSLEFPFAPNGLPNAFGMPTGDRYVRAVVPLVSSADMWVEQNAGVQKNYYFSSGKYKNNAGKRWGLQSDATAETGSNAGSDFRINAYDDSGTYTRTPVYIKRSNGYIGIATTSPTRMIDINSDAVRLRTAKTPASATSSGEQGQICWDANYIYVCVATNTWKRTPLTTW